MYVLKESKPLISIVLPVYNGSKYLEGAIKSVINQTYDNWELILIDDGSKDDTEKIAKFYQKKDQRIFSMHFDKCSGGPAFPRNVGLKKSKGIYIAFLDADDYWDKNKLEEQLNFLDFNSKQIISSEARKVDEKGNYFGNFKNVSLFRNLKKYLNTLNILLIFNPVTLSSSLIKKSEYLKFREDKILQSIEDWALWIDLVIKGYEIKLIQKPLCSYRVHSESISHQNSGNQYKKGFYLYSFLFRERKIGFFKFFLLIIFHTARLIKFYLLGR